MYNIYVYMYIEIRIHIDIVELITSKERFVNSWLEPIWVALIPVDPRWFPERLSTFERSLARASSKMLASSKEHLRKCSIQAKLRRQHLPKCPIQAKLASWERLEVASSLKKHWFYKLFLKHTLGLLGSILKRLGSILERLVNVLERFWNVLERLGSVLGASWTVLGASWSVLGASWSVLGLSGRVLGAFCD